MIRFVSADADRSFYFGVERRFELRFYREDWFWEVHIGWLYFGRV